MQPYLVLRFDIHFGRENDPIVLQGTLRIRETYVIQYLGSSSPSGRVMEVEFLEDGGAWDRRGAISRCGHGRHKFLFWNVNETHWNNGEFSMTVFETDTT